MPVLVVGLGNPGKTYAHTRHNIGFLVVDAFVKKHDGIWKHDAEKNADVCKLRFGTTSIITVKPMTFMNRSGDAVSKLMHFYKLTEKHLVIVHDEVDIPFGDVRARFALSAGGHNGVKSIQAHIPPNTELFRVRMGVGRGDTTHKEKDLAEHVLLPFTKEEQTELDTFITRGVVALEEYLAKQVE